ncbi:hypothetical protein [Streptomyces sp. BA2]|nr:hypothetical protein [Streptomyces sp. BA2]
MTSMTSMTSMTRMTRDRHEWITIASYENASGRPRPMAAVRA